MIRIRYAVVICGKIGSGKSTAVAYLASQLGFKTVSFGTYIRDVAEQRGFPSTRGALQDLGDRLFKAMGSSDLLQAALRYAKVEGGDSAVFDGVRHAQVLADLRQAADRTTAIYLDVGQEERYRRHRARSVGRGLSFEDFQALDGHPVEAGINDLANLCDLVMDADHSLATVRRSLLAQSSLPNGGETEDH